MALASGGYWQSDEIFARRKWRPKEKRTRDRRERILFDVKARRRTFRRISPLSRARSRITGKSKVETIRLEGSKYF